MKPALLVVTDFLEHVKGDLITDAKLIEQYLESGWQANVVQTTTAEPSPAFPAEPAKAVEPTET